MAACAAKDGGRINAVTVQRVTLSFAEISPR